MLLLEKRKFWFPAPIWRLTTVHNSNSRESDIFFWPTHVPGIHTVHVHTYMQAKHSTDKPGMVAQVFNPRT